MLPVKTLYEDFKELELTIKQTRQILDLSKNKLEKFSFNKLIFPTHEDPDVIDNKLINIKQILMLTIYSYLNNNGFKREILMMLDSETYIGDDVVYISINPITEESVVYYVDSNIDEDSDSILKELIDDESHIKNDSISIIINLKYIITDLTEAINSFLDKLS